MGKEKEEREYLKVCPDCYILKEGLRSLRQPGMKRQAVKPGMAPRLITALRGLLKIFIIGSGGPESAIIGRSSIAKRALTAS
jgi:hypothetical protein